MSPPPTICTPSSPLATALAPVDVGADVVALDHVARRACAGDRDAVRRIAGDDVAGAGRRPADRVARSPRQTISTPLMAVGQRRAVPVASVPM